MPIRRLFLRPFTIRQWSALLVTICILPSALAVCSLVYFSYRRERANIENFAIGISRALMQAIDRDLSSATGTLESLATSPYLTQDDLAAFHRQASEIASNISNSNVVLIDPSGQQIINTLRPHGAALPLYGNVNGMRNVTERRRADVSNLYFGAVAQHLVVSVDVPVMRNGKVKYVLAMQSFPHRLGEILARQRIPEGWVAAVLDSNGIVVARTRESARFIGNPGTPRLLATMKEVSEGSVEDKTLEGIPSIAFFTRSSISNWTVAIGVHRSIFTQTLTRTITWITAGLLFLFAIGLGFAVAVSERIARSVRGLIAPAMAIGNDEQPHIAELDLREAQEVAHALEEASQLLKKRTEERDRAAAAQCELLVSKHAVEQNEAFLHGIFQESPDAVFLLAPDGRIIRANAEARRMLAVENEQLATLRIDDILLAPRSGKNFHLREAMFSPSSRHAVTSGSQLLARRSDGKLFPVDVMSSPMPLTDTELAIVTIRDATERAENEEALRQSEMRFRSALEHAPIGMAIVSLEGRWIEVNNAACEMLGYTKDELLALTFQDVTHPDDLAHDLDYADRLLRGEIRSYQIEKRYIRKDGSIVPALLTGTVVRNDEGKPVHFIAQMLDIGERKRSEKELKALTNRLALATRASGIAVWEWDLVTDTLTWDDRMRELYGVEPVSGAAGYAVWKQSVHADDVVRVEREITTAIEGSGDFSSEFRVVRPGGEMRIIHADAIVSRRPDGTPVRMTGVNIDVTENRKREEAINTALREKEMLLKELYHRVKNNLQMITSMFNLQVRRLPEGPARVALTEAAGRVRVMALVHEMLYQSGNLASIALDTYVRELCAQLGQLGSSEQRHIEIQVDVEQLQIGIETAIPLGVVLNELISNCLKHAFPDGRHGLVVVRVHRDDVAGRIRLSVSDNGAGFPSGFDAASSGNLGLRLVTALSRQLHGVFAVENRGGAFASLIFPLTELEGEAEHARIGEIA